MLVSQVFLRPMGVIGNGLSGYGSPFTRLSCPIVARNNLGVAFVVPPICQYSHTLLLTWLLNKQSFCEWNEIIGGCHHALSYASLKKELKKGIKGCKELKNKELKKCNLSLRIDLYFEMPMFFYEG